MLRRLGAGTYVTTALGIVVLIAVPFLLDTYNLLQITIFPVMAILALGLSLA